MAGIRKRSSNWNVQIRRSGHPPLSKTFKFKADAVYWANKTEALLDRGGSVLSAENMDIKTLKDLLIKYRDEIVVSKRSGEYETIMINAFLKSQIASLELSKIKPHHFAVYRDQRMKSVSGVTVAREFTIYSHAFKTAVQEWGYLDMVNPLSFIKKPIGHQPRNRRLSSGEPEVLLRSCAESENYLLKPLVVLAIETAMRRSELLNLTWKNVCFDRRIAHLEMTKNGTKRDVPLSSEAITLLRSLPHDISGNVFPLTAAALRGLWNRACKRAGIIDLHFHDLRHEATSRFFEKGLNVMEVATITGHKDLRMLQRYTHLRAEDLAKKLG